MQAYKLQTLLMVLAQLLLDEPDNHLDHASYQLLTQVLADYPGTLLLVSHDPAFVAGVGVEREYWLEEIDLRSI